MSYSRPSKAQREARAELLGTQPRPRRRRWIGRLLVIPLVLAAIASPFVLLNAGGYIGGCPSNEAMTAFWGRAADDVSKSDRDAEIRRQLRCVDFKGLTRIQVAARLGEWTSVKEYPQASKTNKGLYFVWSNGANTPGIGVRFASTHGPATGAGRYEP